MLRKLTEELFGIDVQSFLERHNPKFKVREEQNNLVWDMLNAFENKEQHILMEAPTGTGKTFIYTYISLLEYILKIHSWGRQYNKDELEDIIYKNKIAIVTNNKSLQKQIHKDLENVIIPSLYAFFEFKGYNKLKNVLDLLSVGVYKSRSNYLCNDYFTKTYENIPNDEFYYKMNEYIKLTNDISADYDNLDKITLNGENVFPDGKLLKFSAKDKNCSTCKISTCKFKSKKKHNIIITNYDYLLLLTENLPESTTNVFHTIILDEVHNLPNKLINRSISEFDFYNFLKLIPDGHSDEFVADFKLHIGKVIHHFKFDNPDTGERILNLTYGIRQDVAKKLEYLSTLNLPKTKDVIVDEYNKVKKYYDVINYEKIEYVTDYFERELLTEISSRIKYIKENLNLYYLDTYKVLTDYNKMKVLLEYITINDVDNFKNSFAKSEDDKYSADESDKLDELFEYGGLLHNDYNNMKKISDTLNGIAVYKKILSHLTDYIKRLENMIDIINCRTDRVNPEYTQAGVISLNFEKDNSLIFNIMNDDVKSLYKKFFDKISDVLHIIYCSATITTDGNFDFFIERLGLETVDRFSEPYTCYRPKSPFDPNKKHYIMLTKEFAKENSYRRGYVDIIENYSNKLATSNDSGTLMLCTSKNDVNLAFENLKTVKDVISPHSQYESSLPNITLDVNNPATKTVVVGNTGLWEGIDFQGDVITQLIITKLPYLRINEPFLLSKFNRCLFEKIENKSRHSFVGEYWYFYNGLMKITFYQGVGRLIRGVDDYGIIVCLFSQDTLSKKFNLYADSHLGITKNISVANDINDLINQIKYYSNHTKLQSKCKDIKT